MTLPGPCLAVAVAALLLVAAAPVFSQTGEVHGQASLWLESVPEHSAVSQLGLRYIPDFLGSLHTWGDVDLNAELSLNALGDMNIDRSRSPTFDRMLKLYRGWVRLSTENFEVRIGLQKLSFGPAMLFRPLMWFDRIDPRDPLQLTDGVDALLLRYYFRNNANIWAWGLYGNSGTKGWELEPTERGTVEYGGRIQSPLWTGEMGATYHHRRADQASLAAALVPPAVPPVAGAVPAALPAAVPEDRFALDGKWDIGIGLWFEAALTHRENALRAMAYRRLWTVGGDYTVGIGNGLYITTEYFTLDNPAKPLGPAAGLHFSGLSMTYPVGIVDQVSVIAYRDWRGHEWYRILTWQRKYDNWIFYLLGFWNPDTIRMYGDISGSNAFAGTGLQFMVVFNH
jgi:hypothetical protein